MKRGAGYWIWKHEIPARSTRDWRMILLFTVTQVHLLIIS